MAKTILLVDDDEVNNYINERLLRKLEIAEEVVVCSNGKEGLDYIKSTGDNLPELVFLDLNMPVMDGFEFYSDFKRLLKASGGKSEVIMLSGSEKPADLEKAHREGIKYYIMKPLKKENVLELLGKIRKQEHFV